MDFPLRGTVFLTDHPTISVITPVYNAVRFLPQVVESVKSQCEVNVEHILVDDCSTDGSLELLHKLASGNPSIKIFALPTNSGPVVARNYAVTKATGRYLAFLDADDLWLPEKCSIQLAFMQKTGAAITFTDYRFISEDGCLIGRRLRGPRQIGWHMHHMTRYLGCLTIMLDRDMCPGFVFPDINPSYRAEDFLAWSMIIKNVGPVWRVPHDLARYTVVKNSRSSRPVRAALSVWKLFRYVEKIPLYKVCVYFSIYSIFASAKRFFCRPQWPRACIDDNWVKLD